MRKSVLNRALRIARAKVKTHPQYMHYIHYSFVVQRNSIVEWGRNHNGVPAIHYGYHDPDRYPMPKTHSEVDAYRKARDLLRKGPFTLVNVRVTRTGIVKTSKPCACCYSLLKALGCNQFFYSTENGFRSMK